MFKSIIAVVSGFLLIVTLALTADMILLSVVPELFTDGATRSQPLLILTLTYSFLFAVAGGYLTAIVAQRAEITHAFALGLLYLTMAALAAWQFGETAPAWWHIAVLALIVPAVMLGGFLRVRRKFFEPRTV